MDRRTIVAVALCVAFLLLYRPILHRFGLDRYLTPAAHPARTALVDTTRRDTTAIARGATSLGGAAGRAAASAPTSGAPTAPGAPSLFATRAAAPAVLERTYEL